MQRFNLTAREFIDKIKEVKATGGWEFYLNTSEMQLELLVRADEKVYITSQIGDDSNLMAELSGAMFYLLTSEWKW